MLTFQQVLDFVNKKNINKDTDLFSILSLMNLDFKESSNQRSVDLGSSLSTNKIEYSTQDVLDLFGS